MENGMEKDMEHAIGKTLCFVLNPKQPLDNKKTCSQSGTLKPVRSRESGV